MMVVVKELTKTFKDDAGYFDVLRKMEFSINRGEMVSLVGASGAGKTTLLQILGGLDIPTSGVVTIDGQDLNNLTARELANYRALKIGFVYQFHHLLPDFSAIENVFLPGMIIGKKRVDCISRAKELLEIMGLSNRASHHPSELSGGERQRVALARALFNKPALILADEPTGNLDTENSLHMLELIKKTNKELGQTFLVATHNEHLAEAMDRSIHIIDGKTVTN